jgi:argininosuccinate lyase
LASEESWRRIFWSAIGHALTAHAVMLRDTSILDDDSAAALLTAVDAARRGEAPAVNGSLQLIGAFDERVDSLTAPGSAGASRIGRARHDVAATDAARGALIDLAESHVFTLMPAWTGSSALQPTNFAHFLTGTIAPLSRSARRLRDASEDVDRAALGAAALAGPGLPVDRDEVSDLLGAESPAESTFDALSAIDHLTAVSDAAAGMVRPMRRLVGEFLLWLRTEPNALRLADQLLAPPDPNLPHFRPPAVLERLIAQARLVEAQASTVNAIVGEIPYGPVGELTDAATETAAASLVQAATVSSAFAMLISGPIELNRAWLARNAGRGLITTGDLGDFLIAEEGLSPAAAREIAALTTRRARQEELEASAITPALIDSAAMVVIGRELGIEIERLGAHLAPRRFVEKRTVLGGPAAPAVREVLQRERQRLEADERWLEERQRRIALASENLEIRSREILAAASTG